MSEAHFPIQLVARLTGLSAHVIRIWEQRYRAVEPSRTPSNRRLYSQGDVDRLNLLREATLAGHSIGQIARLPLAKLRSLTTPAHEGRLTPVRPPVLETAAEPFLDACLRAMQALDTREFEGSLKRAAAVLGSQGSLLRVVAPLAHTVGEWWRDGKISAAHEHFATGLVRDFLGSLTRPYGGTGESPRLVVATPAGQLHELGALLAGAMAASLGWRVTCLGASLPAAEIAGAVRQKGARAVALSVVYPEDDASLPAELRRLRESLPPETALIVGGRALPAYREAVESIGAIGVKELSELGHELDKLRQLAGKARS